MSDDDIVEKLKRKIIQVRTVKEVAFTSLSNEIREEMEKATNEFTQRELYLLLESVKKTEETEDEEVKRLLDKPKIRRIK